MNPKKDRPPEPSGPAPAARGGWLPLAPVLLLAFVLRFPTLGAQSFWGDEVASIAAGKYDLLGSIQYYLIDPHPPLFFVLVRLWLVFGESEFWLRTLPAIAGLLSVAAVYALGRRVLGRGVAVAGSLLLAVTPLHVWNSQDLRSISLLCLLSVCSVHFFYRFLREGNRRLRALWIASTVLMLYTHYFSFFVFGFEALWALWERRKGALRRGTVRVLAVSVLLYLPWIPFFLMQLSRGQPWRASKGAGRILSQTLFYFTTSHSPWKYETFLPRLERIYYADGALFAGIVLVLLFPFLFFFLRGLFSSGDANDGLGFVRGYALVPLGLALAATLWVPVYEVKYMLGVLPGFSLLTGRGAVLTLRRNRAAGLALVAWMAVLLVLSLVHLYADPSYHRPAWKQTMEVINGEAEAGDAVLVFQKQTACDFLYYYKGKAPVVQIVDKSESGTLEDEAPVMRALEKVPHARRVWFLKAMEYFHDPEHVAHRYLEQRFHKTGEWVIRDETGFRLLRYER